MIMQGRDGEDYFWKSFVFGKDDTNEIEDFLDNTDFLVDDNGNEALKMVGVGNKIVCFFMAYDKED